MFYTTDFGMNVIQFGTGDIEVSNGRVLVDNEKEMFPCVTFAKIQPGKIGDFCSPDKHHEPAEQRDDIHTCLIFTDIRSLDVLLESLQEVKRRFIVNGTRILSPQEITDEV